MNKLQWPRVLLCASAVLLLGSSISPAAEWVNRLFKQVNADPKKEYHLTEENGPWMIMATSFSGEGAREQAKELVLEIRKRFKVEAYMFEKVFDLSKPMPGGRVNPYGEQTMLRYQRSGKFKEIAVLVGDYPAIDDPTAQEMLEKLKYADIHCMRLEEGRRDHQSLGGLRYLQQQIRRQMQGNKSRAKGRLGKAFITTNPLLPEDYFDRKGLEPFVVRLNKPLEYSLLTCPGRYTVQVATFTGKVVVDPKKIKQIESSDRFESGLEAAAKRAHDLTLALRKQGVEAYEFHDRYQSIVCIGSFNSYGHRRADGKIEINPQMFAIMQRWGPERNAQGAVSKPRQLKGIPFDLQPQIVQVPKESPATRTAGNGFGLFR